MGYFNQPSGTGRRSVAPCQDIKVVTTERRRYDILNRLDILNVVYPPIELQCRRI